MKSIEEIKQYIEVCKEDLDHPCRLDVIQALKWVIEEA